MSASLPNAISSQQVSTENLNPNQLIEDNDHGEKKIIELKEIEIEEDGESQENVGAYDSNESFNDEESKEDEQVKKAKSPVKKRLLLKFNPDS